MAGRGAPPGTRYGGRTKGTPNKITIDVRLAIAKIAQDNVGKFQDWLDTVAEIDPARAAELYLRAIEYHIPKLGRTIIEGDPNKPMTIITRAE